MNNRAIHRLLKSNIITRNVFAKVTSIDKLPTHPRKRKPVAYIINLSESFKPGTHWVSTFHPIGSGKNEYFDSFGRPPPNLIKKFLGKKYIFNNKKLQSFLASTCGQFTLYYTYMRSRNISQRKILKILSDKHKKGVNLDFFVNREIKRIFNTNKEKVYDYDFYLNKWKERESFLV